MELKSQKWEVIPVSNCTLSIQCKDERNDKRGYYVAEINWPKNVGGISEKDRANAQLMAAAPMLLNSLEEMMKILSPIIYKKGVKRAFSELVAMEAAKKAINMAISKPIK